MLAVCVLAQAVPFWALAEGEESEKITPTPAEQEGEEAASTQDDQAGQAQPAPTPAEAQEPQPEAGLLSAPQPRAGVTKEVRCLDGDGSEKTQTATEDDDVENGSPNSLTIYGQQEGTGALTATGAMHGESGIGGQYKENNSGAFTMNGGFVTAQGGGYAAGIGGAWDGVGLNVVFNGGYVEVTGNIGAGYDNSDAGSFTTGLDCDGVLAVSGGTQITVNGDGATLTPDGELQLPEGGSLTVDTGAGTVTVTPPAVKKYKKPPAGKTRRGAFGLRRSTKMHCRYMAVWNKLPSWSL